METGSDVHPLYNQVEQIPRCFRVARSLTFSLSLSHTHTRTHTHTHTYTLSLSLSLRRSLTHREGLHEHLERVDGLLQRCGFSIWGFSTLMFSSL